MKKSIKKNSFCRGNFIPFMRKKFSNLRPLLCITFPQGFLKSKKFAHRTSGSGGKRPLKGVRNTNSKGSKAVWEGLKNHVFNPHFDTLFTPPPLLSTLVDYNNIMKFKYHPQRLTPPPPSHPYPHFNIFIIFVLMIYKWYLIFFLLFW